MINELFDINENYPICIGIDPSHHDIMWILKLFPYHLYDIGNQVAGTSGYETSSHAIIQKSNRSPLINSKRNKKHKKSTLCLYLFIEQISL